MRIVPVLDLKGGIVVHARRGQRADYAPLRSPLVDGCEPVTVARAVCTVAQSSSLYVADLDALAGEPVGGATLATTLGVRELLVIDLARVGSGSGPPLRAVAELAAALPELAIYAGGGVRDDHDLRALQSAGATGALVATALHEGRITP